MFWLWSALPRLRSLGAAPIRVRTPVGGEGLLRLRLAPRRLPELRRPRRGGSLGGGQAPSNDDLLLVPGQMGQASELEGGCRSLSDQLVQRLSRCRDGCGVGPRSSGLG